MIWALSVKSPITYIRVVERAFKLKMAVLDVQNCDSETVTLQMTYTGKETFILCHLKKGVVEQVNLNLSFSKGEVIAFSVAGNGTVHLSGYTLHDKPGNGEENFTVVEYNNDSAQAGKEEANDENGREKENDENGREKENDENGREKENDEDNREGKNDEDGSEQENSDFDVEKVIKKAFASV